MEWRTGWYIATTSTKRIVMVQDHRSLSKGLAYPLDRVPRLELVAQVVSAERRRFVLSGKGCGMVSRTFPLAARQPDD